LKLVKGSNVFDSWEDEKAGRIKRGDASDLFLETPNLVTSILKAR
jgi:hypothetical protein